MTEIVSECFLQWKEFGDWGLEIGKRRQGRQGRQDGIDFLTKPFSTHYSALKNVNFYKLADT
ncbi:hypothetical protein CLI64_28165 [Nostoc sp. CENA543]|nr:hypothetical protein CLI64_28165 [Nostoc sp. CENA543]